MSASGRILLVDDEEELRRTVARIFQRAGFEITTAASGQEALRLFADQPFDLVYLDIRMPDMSGLDVLKAIHSLNPEMPVVLFTAQPDLDSALEALRHGARDYFLKPLQPEKLINRTRGILVARKTERRKREIQSQVEALQTELKSLEDGPVAAAEAQPRAPEASERFFKRGSLVLDLHAHRLTIGSHTSTMPPASFEYLRVLAKHAPDTVDYRTLVAEAQGYSADFREAQQLAKWHIHHIRQGIEVDGQNKVILLNVRGEGYRLLTD